MKTWWAVGQSVSCRSMTNLDRSKHTRTHHPHQHQTHQRELAVSFLHFLLAGAYLQAQHLVRVLQLLLVSLGGGGDSMRMECLGVVGLGVVCVLRGTPGLETHHPAAPPMRLTWLWVERRDRAMRLCSGMGGGVSRAVPANSIDASPHRAASQHSSSHPSIDSRRRLLAGGGRAITTNPTIDLRPGRPGPTVPASRGRAVAPRWDARQTHTTTEWDASNAKAIDRHPYVLRIAVVPCSMF